MKPTILGLTLLAAGSSLPAPAAAKDTLRARVLERFEEKCSAERLTLITVRGLGRNTDLAKGKRTGYLRMRDLGPHPDLAPPDAAGEIRWVCGDTQERSACPRETTHLRVQRAAAGRNVEMTCYRVERCGEGQALLSKLDDRCGEDVLRIGGQRLRFRERKEGIPYSAADISPPGAVRWYCGGTAERSQCPPGTTVLDVERRDRDTRLFHIECKREGGQCTAHHGSYDP